MAFVVSGGQLAAVERRPALIGPTSVDLSETVRQTYAVLYRTQPAVRTVVSFLARNVAHLGLHLYERVSDVDRRRVTDHPAAKVLSKPNPTLTPFRLWQHVVSELAIYDNALVVKVRPEAGQPAALVPVPMSMVEPVDGNWLLPGGFKIKGSGTSLVVPRENAIHLRGYNPDDPRWGASPLESLRELLGEELAAARYRRQLWNSRARLSGVIERPKEAGGWKDEVRTRFREQWRELYTGDSPLAGGTPILEDGMTFRPIAITPEAAQYIEARKLTREEVAAAFHIPAPMVGILDHATFSNITEQHKNLYQDTLGPLLEQIQQDFELQLLDDFDGTEGLYLEFNLGAKLAGSFEEQAATLQTSVGAPWLTRNEARARMNLPQLDGGDDLVVPLNVLIGGQASPTDSAPPVDAAKAAPPEVLATLRAQRDRARLSGKARADDNVQAKVAEVLAAYFGRQGASVLSALGAGKTLEEAFDVARWDGELASDLYQVGALIAETAGKATLDALGLDPASFTLDTLLAWLKANAEGVATGINEATRAQLADAENDDDPGTARAAVFTIAKAVRAPQIAVTQTTAVSGFGTVEAVKGQSRQAVKVWHAGSNARSAHARLDGETAPLEGVFTNGARWPGDSQLPPDERAGCNCRMTVALQEEQ